MTNKIVLTLRVNLAKSDRHDFICNFTSISCVEAKYGELFGCSEIVKKLKYLQAKQRMCRECKDYVIGREITTELIKDSLEQPHGMN